MGLLAVLMTDSTGVFQYVWKRVLLWVLGNCHRRPDEQKRETSSNWISSNNDELCGRQATYVWRCVCRSVSSSSRPSSSSRLDAAPSSEHRHKRRPPPPSPDRERSVCICIFTLVSWCSWLVCSSNLFGFYFKILFYFSFILFVVLVFILLSVIRFQFLTAMDCFENTSYFYFVQKNEKQQY